MTTDGRKLHVERLAVMRLIPAAEAVSISARTAREWLVHFEEHGRQGLLDRSSRPTKTRTILDERLREAHQAAALSANAQAAHRRSRRAQRRHRLPATCAAGPVEPGVARFRLNPVCAISARAPGDFLQFNTKKLGRIVRPSHRVTGDRRDSADGAGWDLAHIAIDDHSRVGFVQMRTNERRDAAVHCLLAAVAH